MFHISLLVLFTYSRLVYGAIGPPGYTVAEDGNFYRFFNSSVFNFPTTKQICGDSGGQVPIFLYEREWTTIKRLLIEANRNSKLNFHGAS